MHQQSKEPSKLGYLSNKLLLLLGAGGGGSIAKTFVNNRIGSFAEQFDLSGRCSDDHRHPLPVAVEFEDVQQFVAVLCSFRRYLSNATDTLAINFFSFFLEAERKTNR